MMSRLAKLAACFACAALAGSSKPHAGGSHGSAIVDWLHNKSSAPQSCELSLEGLRNSPWRDGCRRIRPSQLPSRGGRSCAERLAALKRSGATSFPSKFLAELEWSPYLQMVTQRPCILNRCEFQEGFDKHTGGRTGFTCRGYEETLARKKLRFRPAPPRSPTGCALERASDRELAAAASALTADCATVAFTTVYFAGGAQLPDPKTKLRIDANFSSWDRATLGELCYVLVADAATAASLRAEHGDDLGAWRLLADPTPDRAGRRASRRVKLTPALFFAAPRTRFVVFFDWKLELRLDPRYLAQHTLLTHRVGFAAFRHPCTTTSTCCGAAKRHGNALCNRPDPTLAWWETEARIVERRNITANPAALRAQVARYEAYGIAFGQYIDGALLVWDVRHPVSAELSCAWWSEYDRPDSSDRDQLSFGYAIATIPALAQASLTARQYLFNRTLVVGGVLILNRGKDPHCRPLCHWYDSETLALKTAKTLNPRLEGAAPAQGGVHRPSGAEQPSRTNYAPV